MGGEAASVNGMQLVTASLASGPNRIIVVSGLGPGDAGEDGALPIWERRAALAHRHTKCPRISARTSQGAIYAGPFGRDWTTWRHTGQHGWRRPLESDSSTAWATGFWHFGQ